MTKETPDLKQEGGLNPYQSENLEGYIASLSAAISDLDRIKEYAEKDHIDPNLSQMLSGANLDLEEVADVRKRLDEIASKLEGLRTE